MDATEIPTMSKLFKAIFTSALSLATGSIVSTAAAADAPAADSSSKRATALTPLAQLVQLMDTNKDGKVSKEEFMKFMESEFDYADRQKTGQLDPGQLKHLVFQVNHPYSPRLGK
jgi:EF hand domain-containing protein